MNQAGKRVMVVDDEAVIVQQLEDVLQDMGYEVAGAASSGKEALRKAGDLKPDLVLMDVVMPGKMDGIEACDLIQKNFDIPVLLLTAHGEDGVLERVEKVHPYGYIIKPFQEQQLKAAIQLALGQKKSESNRPMILSQQHIKLLQDVSSFSGMERYHGLMPERHALLYDDEVVQDLLENNLVDEGHITTSCGLETKGYRLSDTARDDLARLGVDLRDHDWDQIKDSKLIIEDELTREDIELLTEVYHYSKIKRHHGIAPKELMEDCDKKRLKDLYKSGYLFNIRLKGQTVKHEKGYVLTEKAHSLLKHVGVS